MPLASDTSTGGRAATVDRDIIAAAAKPSRSREVEDRVSSSPIASQGLPMYPPDGSRNTTGRTNPVPTNMYGPTRAEIVAREMNELAMRTGALTTVDEVEDRSTGVAAWDARLAQRDALASTEEPENPGTGAGARAGNPGRALQQKQDAEDEREMSQAERAFKSGVRATRAGVNQGGSAERTKAMTSEEFAALSPRQKAAVELNSMLTAAIAADLGLKQKGDPGGEEYDGAVEKLFTGEGKTATYAPNTVGVLENIGWSAPATDLDDILSGKALFTRQDIADLAMPENRSGPDARLNTPEKMRDDIQSSLVKAFTAARKEPVQGENLVAAKQELLNYKDLPGFSEKPGREVVPGVDVNTFIRSGFDLLSNSNSGFTPEQIIADARQNLDDTEFQAFLNFVDVNSRDAKNYRQPLGSTEGQTYFDPVEFRKSIAAVLRKER